MGCSRGRSGASLLSCGARSLYDYRRGLRCLRGGIYCALDAYFDIAALEFELSDALFNYEFDELF